jgi:two-component system phosphate regulon response regulator PhoB
VTETSDQPTFKILVVEDDPQVRASILLALRADGLLCSEAGDAARARRVISKARPDLVVLDLGLPDGDGLDLLRELRTTDDLPVVVCSGRGTENDRVVGLDVGADDYLPKPFSSRELRSRVRSVLRRARSAPPVTVVAFGEAELNLDTREVTLNGEPVSLTAREFELASFLALHPRTVFSRAELLKEVWRASPADKSEATVTEHMRRLRLKLEVDAASPRHLRAVRGVGYRLVP